MKYVIRCLALGLILAPAFAAADDKDKPASGIDKKTGEVLKKVGALFKDAKSLHADVLIESVIEPEGQDKRELKVKTTIDMKRPNLIAIKARHVKEAGDGLDYISDGKNLVTHVRRLKQYTETPAPDEMAEVGGRLLRVPGNRNAVHSGMLFQNVLAEDPEEQLLEGVTKGEYAGVQKVNGKETHHLKFKQDPFDWELWVAAEGEPFVLKALTEYSPDAGGAKVTETYSNWKLNADPPKDAFNFTAPDDAKKVKQIAPPQRKDG